MTSGGPPGAGLEYRIGDLLVRRGLLTTRQLSDALKGQGASGALLGDYVLAQGWVRPLDFFAALAEHLGRPFVNLQRAAPDPALLDSRCVRDYLQLLTIPHRRENGEVVVATANPGPDAFAFARRQHGDRVIVEITSPRDIVHAVQAAFGSDMTDTSVTSLMTQSPELSAHTVFTEPQLAWGYGLAAAFLLVLVLRPVPTLVAVVVFITLFYLASILLRVLLVWVGSSHRIDVKVTDAEVHALDDRDLPVYTILVPMYKEASVLPHLARGIRALDYPRSQLDVKLVLEEDDDETFEAAKSLALEGFFEIIRVPTSLPKTKPKACNYALNFARGSFLTIYDAEDRPEPDQLKKALAAFAKATPQTACFQARLNYFNRGENWLTRMFTLDYSLWFDFLLPGLEKLGIPVPLGGTSNHFRIEVLRKLQGWDPFNVTEDADLGVRLAQQGYRCGVLNSTTFEEANNHLGNWIRQRSRWIKGYMQTYLVYMRRPLVLYRSLGHAGFWGFQFFIGGSVLVVLLNPWLWVLFFAWMFGTLELRTFFPGVLLTLSIFNLLLGNAVFTYFNMIGAFKRRYYDLVPYGMTSLPYWWLMSLAAYKALWQLLHNPFFWEKTDHGLTRLGFDHDNDQASEHA